MITISNKQENVQWIGEVDNYNISGSYTIMDGVVASIYTDVYEAGKYLGHINYSNVSDGIDSNHTAVSYDCDYKYLNKLTAFLPVLLEEIKSHVPDAMILPSADDTTAATSEPTDDSAEETKE